MLSFYKQELMRENFRNDRSDRKSDFCDNDFS